jgi:fumarate reductase subunit C
MTIWRGEEKVDPKLIVAANYGVWLIVSLVIFLIAVGG